MNIFIEHLNTDSEKDYENKRYYWEKGGCKNWHIIDIRADHGTYDRDSACDLLNDKDKEIEYQKQRVKVLQQELQDTKEILKFLTRKLEGYGG